MWFDRSELRGGDVGLAASCRIGLRYGFGPQRPLKDIRHRVIHPQAAREFCMPARVIRGRLMMAPSMQGLVRHLRGWAA